MNKVFEIFYKGNNFVNRVFEIFYKGNNFTNKVFEIFYKGNNFVNKVFEIFYIGNNKKPIRQFEFKKRIVVLSYFLNCFTIQKVRQKIHILTRWR